MIYVLCPADVKTGGTELLHQLVKTLTDVKVPAGIVYTEISEEHPGMNPAFLEYTDGYLREEEIEDEKGNILVVPEIYCERTARYQNLSVYIWWLSVDNYLIHNSFVDRRRANGTLRAIKALLTGKLKDKTDFVKKAKMHLCQSYYAIHYLETIGISGKQVRYLSDYVNDIYLAGEEAALREKKEDVVLYNPKKGAAFTKALREMAQDLRWVPLIGMTTEEMRSCMSKSKVYIDFGNHPGKDRIPRERQFPAVSLSLERGVPRHSRRMYVFRKHINLMSHVRKKKILYHASGIVSVILMCTRLILTVTEVILEMNISNLLQM